MADQERRGHPRTARPIMGRYRRPDQSAWCAAPLKDLSRTGARLLSEESFEVGEPLELWLGLPLFVQPVQLASQVVWKKAVFSGSLELTELGLAFGKLDNAVQKMLDEGVQRFLNLSRSSDK